MWIEICSDGWVLRYWVKDQKVSGSSPTTTNLPLLGPSIAQNGKIADVKLQNCFGFNIVYFKREICHYQKFMGNNEIGFPNPEIACCGISVHFEPTLPPLYVQTLLCLHYIIYICAAHVV